MFRKGGLDLFENRVYQMKDLMEMFDISRDVIKYYEGLGLISSERKANGYRVFDEMNALKLKKILSLREFNMTVEEISRLFVGETDEERMKVMSAARMRTENEIRKLNENLRKIRFMEKEVSSHLRFVNGFNLDKDLRIYINCTSLPSLRDQIFYNSPGICAGFTPEKGLFDMENCNLILEHMDNPITDVCTHAQKVHEIAMCLRARVLYESEEQIVNLLREAWSDLRNQEYTAQGMVYMRKKIIQVAGEDRMILDILLPIVEKQA